MTWSSGKININDNSDIEVLHIGRAANSRGPSLSLLPQWYPPLTTLAASAARDAAPALAYSATIGAAAPQISGHSVADSIVSRDRGIPTTTILKVAKRNSLA
jgi:hypothetical protein